MPRLSVFALILLFASGFVSNNDPERVQLITTDLTNFWEAFQKAQPDFDPSAFQELYIDKASKGMKGFIDGRIVSAEYLAKVVKKHAAYYGAMKASIDSIEFLKPQIIEAMRNLKGIYPVAEFPDVYFVVGTLNSGGTTSRHGLLIGAEMYAVNQNSPMNSFDQWHLTVMKRVGSVPHIVAHELIHYQQTYDGEKNLLWACLKEGSADLIAELISGSHINNHVHDFANPREKELWAEFQTKMNGKDRNGWLYTSTEGRPNDLGYWMGYKITKAYYDKATDKKQAVHDILNIKNAEEFLSKSGYGN